MSQNGKCNNHKKKIADRKHDLKINKSWNKTTVH